MIKKEWSVILFFLLLSCGQGADPLGHNGLCDGYVTPSLSPYILPYASGSSYTVAQGNCSGISHFSTQRYAYDIDMPIGTTLVATRAGTVIAVEERYQDGSPCPDNNYINIEHSDGTVASYVHLTQSGALVSLGDVITQGQTIALSGNTGCSSGPHLHLVLWKNKDKKQSSPLTFSNTSTPHPRGLQKGTSYKAQ